MLDTTPEKLAAALGELYPEETGPEIPRIVGNRLATYRVSPERKVSLSNWHGKVTRALFKALEIKQPKTKAECLRVLGYTGGAV